MIIKRFNLLIWIFILILPRVSWGQDERFFRQIFSGDLKDGVPKDQSEQIKRSFWYKAQTPFYELDLNRDGITERIVFAKKDNEDWIDIFDHVRNKIFSYRFENMGINSGLYRIEQRTLSPETDILFLYYYVGSTKFMNTDASARLYLLTIDRRNLKSLHVLKASSFFEERRTFRQHYHQSKYSVELREVNNDLVKEVIVSHRGMNEVFLYRGDGKWKTFLR